MDSYRSFDAWKVAHEICIKTLRGLDQNYHPRSRALIDQLRRAVISIEANIVEGYALRSRPYLYKHARIAIGSAAESECLMRNSKELAYLPDKLTDEILPLLDRELALLWGILRRK